jgi:hypothetical protein
VRLSVNYLHEASQSLSPAKASRGVKIAPANAIFIEGYIFTFTTE